MGQQFVGLVAVPADVLRHEDQRKRGLRAEPIKNGRAVLDDAVGIGQGLEMPCAGDRGADQFRQRLQVSTSVGPH